MFGFFKKKNNTEKEEDNKIFKSWKNLSFFKIAEDKVNLKDYLSEEKKPENTEFYILKSKKENAKFLILITTKNEESDWFLSITNKKQKIIKIYAHTQTIKGFLKSEIIEDKNLYNKNNKSLIKYIWEKNVKKEKIEKIFINFILEKCKNIHLAKPETKEIFTKKEEKFQTYATIEIIKKPNISFIITITIKTKEKNTCIGFVTKIKKSEMPEDYEDIKKIIQITEAIKEKDLDQERIFFTEEDIIHKDCFNILSENTNFHEIAETKDQIKNLKDATKDFKKIIVVSSKNDMT